MFNRRRFLLSGAAAAAGAAALPAARALPTDSPAKWDETYDVVIVGAGGGGLMAAAWAARSGLKAVVLEKLVFPGGSTLLCGGSWSVSESAEQKKRGIKDSDALFLEDMLKVGQHKNNPELVKAMIASTRESYKYVTEELGLQPDAVNAVSGMSVPRAHHFEPPELIATLKKAVEDLKVPVKYSTAAERLVVEKGVVTGVKAVSKGKTLWIGAKKGVLLACGGFSKNRELLEKFNARMAGCDLEGGAGNVGDGLKMAQALGADVLDTQFIKATFGYRPDPKKYGPQTLHGYYSGAILVNAAAKRFVNESISYKLLSDAALEQPEVKVWELFDEPIRKKMCDSGKKYRRLLSPLDNGGEVEYCIRGNSIQEVAEKAGLNPKVLEETVARYNAFAEKGTDADFGRTSLTSGFGKLAKIETGPFFLYPARPRLIATYCGVKIDPKARVVDVFGEPIPHLYACGEVTGGVHGAAYMSGTAVGKTMGFGRIAILEMAGRA